MTIEEQDFRLIPCGGVSPNFDLEILYVVNKGKENERKEFKNVGYGLPLEAAIRRIISNRIENKHKEEAISLKIFLEEYKTEVNKIKQLLV